MSFEKLDDTIRNLLKEYPTDHSKRGANNERFWAKHLNFSYRRESLDTVVLR